MSDHIIYCVGISNFLISVHYTRCLNFISYSNNKSLQAIFTKKARSFPNCTVQSSQVPILCPPGLM